MAENVGLTRRAARRVKELIRDSGAQPDPTGGGPAPGLAAYVIRCGTLISTSPRPHYNARLRALPGLSSHADLGTADVVLAPLDAAGTLTPGRDYEAIRGGTEAGVPLFWTTGAGAAFGVSMDVGVGRAYYGAAGGAGAFLSQTVDLIELTDNTTDHLLLVSTEASVSVQAPAGGQVPAGGVLVTAQLDLAGIGALAWTVGQLSYPSNWGQLTFGGTTYPVGTTTHVELWKAQSARQHACQIIALRAFAYTVPVVARLRVDANPTEPSGPYPLVQVSVCPSAASLNVPAHYGTITGACATGGLSQPLVGLAPSLAEGYGSAKLLPAFGGV